MESAKNFIKASFLSDRIAFRYEMVSLVFTVVASMYIAIYADAPDMRIAYPLFLVGSITGSYANYRRRLALPLILNKFFSIVNIFGFGRAMLWW